MADDLRTLMVREARPIRDVVSWLRSQPAWTWYVWLAIFVVHLIQFDVTWFSIDQARDILQASDIAAGRNFPLNGPQMHWLAHIGPLYYYVLALPFLFVSHPSAVFLLLALQATVTVACGFYFLRRYFQERAALLFLMLYGPSTFVLLDSRALWTPAFLPLWTVLSLWAMASLYWNHRDTALVPLAAIVGIATQFHLSFVLMLLPAIAGWLFFRPRIRMRMLLLALAVGLATYAPYLYFQATHNWVDIRAFLTFAQQAGTGPVAAKLSLGQIVLNYLCISQYLAEHWLQLSGTYLTIYKAVAVLTSCLLILSVVWLAINVFRRWKSRQAESVRLLFLIFCYLWFLGALFNRSVDLYYYYFDLLLPLPFLLMAIFLDEIAGLFSAVLHTRKAIVSGVVLLGIYAVIQVAAFFYWSTNTAADGFFQLSLDRLDLHKFQRAAASKPDKFITLRHKMQIARVLADSKGWSRAEIYDKVLGSRFYDATEERGFWMGYFKPAQSGRASEEPVVLWNQIDPLEKWAKELEVRVENVGPYRLGRLNPENYPQEWEWDDGTKLRMPVRTIPELREYGFVPGHSWPPGVVRLRTQLELKRQPRSYLLVVITKGEKLVPRLWINGVIARAIEKNETLMTAESFYVLSQDLSSGVNQLRLELDHQSGFDLEVFGWAKW